MKIVNGEKWEEKKYFGTKLPYIIGTGSLKWFHATKKYEKVAITSRLKSSLIVLQCMD